MNFIDDEPEEKYNRYGSRTSRYSRTRYIEDEPERRPVAQPHYENNMVSEIIDLNKKFSDMSIGFKNNVDKIESLYKKNAELHTLVEASTLRINNLKSFINKQNDIINGFKQREKAFSDKRDFFTDNVSKFMSDYPNMVTRKQI
jgi:hypothetical protein